MSGSRQAVAVERRPRLFVPLLIVLIAALSIACGSTPKPKDLVREPTAAPSSGTPQVAVIAGSPATPSTATATPAATASATPEASHSPSPTAEPTATATPVPPPVDVLADGTHGYVVSSGTLVYADPTTHSTVVGKLRYEQELQLLAKVRGERFVVGSQDWPMAIQNWSNLWYKTAEGYVYSAYVWIPMPGQVLPESLGPGERWVNVNLAAQTAQVMVGDRVVYTADVTTGKNGFDTPTGHWRVNYQVANETMTSGQAGINDPAEHYDVKNVLFTQYFDGLGDALHLNYWQPESVFGDSRTSHGCVGLYIQDAQWIWMFGQTGMRVEINSNGRILPPPPQPSAPPPTQRSAAPTQAPAPPQAPAPTQPPAPLPTTVRPAATRAPVATDTPVPAHPAATAAPADTAASTPVPIPATLAPTRLPTPLGSAATAPVVSSGSAAMPPTPLPQTGATATSGVPAVTGTPR